VAIDLQWLQRVIERRKREAGETGVRLHPPAMVKEVLEFLRVKEVKRGVFVGHDDWDGRTRVGDLTGKSESGSHWN